MFVNSSFLRHPKTEIAHLHCNKRSAAQVSGEKHRPRNDGSFISQTISQNPMPIWSHLQR